MGGGTTLLRSSAVHPSPVVSIAERRRGAWLGLAIGDALGAPVEFHSADDIRRRHGRVTEMMAGGPWLAGEWTDDTALALATARAYGEDGFHLERAAAAMVAWLESGPKDVGNLTRVALGLIRDGEATGISAGRLALERHPGAAGNGSLMRALPTALWRQVGDVRLVRESSSLSEVTHADARCAAACVVFNVVASALVHDGAEVAAALVTARDAAAGLSPEVDALVDGAIAGEPCRHGGEGIGYVLLCLERALVALRDSVSFEEGLIDVVSQGGDADTNGAVAGALLGARFGAGAIPARWLSALRRRGDIEVAIAAVPGPA